MSANDRVEQWRKRFNQRNYEGFKTPIGKEFSEVGLQKTITKNPILLRAGMGIDDATSGLIDPDSDYTPPKKPSRSQR